MSNDTTNAIKILHEWTISQKKTVDETGPETINGQIVQVTRKVEKDVITKMALKSATRRELHAAALAAITGDDARLAHHAEGAGDSEAVRFVGPSTPAT